MRARQIVFALPLALLLFPGAPEAQKVTPLPSRPLLVRIGYTTYKPPVDVLAGKSSLEDVTEYLKTTRIESLSSTSARPLDFDVSLGNYYQILSWLESKDLDAAVVSAFQAALLQDKGFAVPVAELAFTTQNPDGHWGVITSSGSNGEHPAKDYEEYLTELLAAAKDHPDECPLRAPWRRFRLNVVAHLSTSGFIAPVLYASDWLNERQTPDATVKDRFWDCFFDNINFTMAHSGAVSDIEASDRIEIKFSYQNNKPAALQTSDRLGFHSVADAPTIPNDVLVVRPEMIKYHIEKTFLAGAASWKGTSRAAKPGVGTRDEKDVYVSARPYNKDHYQAFKKQVIGLLANPALVPRFTQWYGEGRYDFSIGDIKKFLLQDQEFSGMAQFSLVLPGGGVKSAYQAEMLDRLYRTGFLTNSRRQGQAQGSLVVENVVGTSGGAIVGLFAAQKREQGDESSLHRLWEPGPEVFPLFEILRWTSLYAVLLLFFFVFYVARILGLLHLGHTPENISSDRAPFWLSGVLLAVLFGGPIVVSFISSGAEQTEVHWGEGLLHLVTILAVYVGMSCCVANEEPHGTVPAKKKLLAPSTLTFLVAAVCLTLSFAARQPLAASTGLLLGVIAVILLARERKLGLRLAGMRDCARALSLLGLVLTVSYGFFSLMSLKGWATSIELTKEFWLTLLLSAFAASLSCLALAEKGSQGVRRYLQRGISYFATPHRLGRFRAEHAQSLSIIFGVGLLWWSYAAAPALYSGTKAYRAFYKNVVASSAGRDRVDLQTNLIVTATALRDVPGAVPIAGSEPLPLPAGDIYFCFSGQQTKCPEKEKVQSKRWFEVRDLSLPEVANPVFASGSPFPVFPPHLVSWNVPGIPKRAEALLVDGGYAHNVPLQAAELAGARQVLVLRSEPFKSLALRRAESFPSQLAQYATLLLPFMFEQAQEIDRSVARGLVVVSLSPFDMKDRKVPLLTDFDALTVQGMLHNADDDFDLGRRIGLVESWGLPTVFRQIHDVKPLDMFKKEDQL